MVCYLAGIQTESHLLNGPMAGPLFENFVIQEVLKFNYNNGKRANIYYLRTHNQLEIDLIIEKNYEIYPIEIKLAKTLNVGMAKSIERFIKLFPGIKIHPGILVSIADESIHHTKNVNCLPMSLLLEKLRLIL